MLLNVERAERAERNSEKNPERNPERNSEKNPEKNSERNPEKNPEKNSERNSASCKNVRSGCDSSMRSFSTHHSPPPSPHPVPLPISSSSSLTCCPELDLSVTLSPSPKAGQSLQKACDPKHRPPQGQTGRRKNRQVRSEEPLVVTVTPEPHLEVSSEASFQQRSRGQRRGRGHHHGLRHLVEPPAATSNQDPSSLKRAELNTTLALKAELQSLQGAQFNSQRAIQETLQKSERTKNLINARATEVVNVSRSQVLFTSLVSVDVPEDQLISQVVQEKLHLAPPFQCRESREAEGPSPLFFLTSDLLRQKPLPPEEKPVGCKLRPSTRPAHSTFDLYRRQLCWEAAP